MGSSAEAEPQKIPRHSCLFLSTEIFSKMQKIYTIWRETRVIPYELLEYICYTSASLEPHSQLTGACSDITTAISHEGPYFMETTCQALKASSSWTEVHLAEESI